MDVRNSHKRLKKISLALVFFCIILIGGCQNDASDDLTILYRGGKASGVRIAAEGEVAVYVAGETDTAVLGELVPDGDHVIFWPVVPFTSGTEYEVYEDGRSLGTFEIVGIESDDIPKVVALYPTADTVPENLLKMYIQFSHPMQEVNSALDYITVWNDTENRAEDIFLELPTELWNAEHTRLTLWLDPGRIKTDLIPNRELGLPIKRGHRYTLRIAPEWQDRNGHILDAPFTKTFYVGNRDNEKPRINKWELQLPKTGTRDPLVVDFGEHMDAILAMESLVVWNDKNQMFSSGRFELTNNERTLNVIPSMDWVAGTYRLTSRANFEDLAGNNLDRLFDRDLNDSTETAKANTSVLFTLE